MSHFPATKTQGYLDFIAATKEFLNAPHFDLIIMLVNVRTKLDFLDLDDLLFFAGLIGAFLRFILEFTIIKYFANWRVNIRLHLNQIKSEIFGLANCFGCIQNSKLVTFWINAAYFWCTNGAIDARAVQSGRRITMWTCYLTLL